MTILATPIIHIENEPEGVSQARDIANKPILRPGVTVHTITTTAELPHGGTWIAMFLDDFIRDNIQTPAIWLQEHKYLGCWYAWFPAPEETS